MKGLHVPPLRALMILSHASYVRDFMTSGLLEMLLARGHHLIVLSPGNLMHRVEAELRGKGALEAVEPLEPYMSGWARSRLRGMLFTASFVQRSHLSTYRHKLRMLNAGSWGALKVKALRWLGRLGDLEAMARAVEARIPAKRRALKLVLEARPDVVVAPTAIYESPIIEVFKAAKQLGVPTLAFPSSWDTLTSKGCFLVRPDGLMVWGEDTLHHAIDYHGYPPERVFVTGPAHFDMYAPGEGAESRESFLARRGIPPEKRVLLFAGTTVTYWTDEPLQLRALSRLIEDGELKDCVIWYRPHPRRAYRDVTELLGLPGVYVDEQMLRQKADGRGGYSIEREDLFHYRGIVEACEGVVTAFSTMIIEAALMGKPSLVVAFGLGDHGSQRLLQHAEYEHMRDVVSTPGVMLCRSMEELKEGIRRLLAGEFVPLAEALRARAGQIAHSLDGRAKERIVKAIGRFACPAESGR